MEKNERKNKGFLAKLESKQLELIVFFLATAILLVVLWPFITITIESGHVGVYYSRLLGGTVLGKKCDEGLNFMLPWDKIIIYNSKAQSKDYSITALAMGGLRVNVDMSVIWAVKKIRVGELHREMGPDYAKNILDPMVVSMVRSVIGRYEQSQLYDGNPLKLQDDVMNLLSETLKNAPFSINAILVREVKLPDQMADAISQKFVSEQSVLAARYRVLEAVERYKRNYVDSESVRVSQSIINDGMSEAYLRYLGIQATKDLASSNNAKLVIIGDKDGLPLMLNPDTLSQSASLPKGLSPRPYHEEDRARMNNSVDIYNRIQGNLNDMSGVLGDLVNKYPHIEEGKSSIVPPQVNSVPVIPKKESGGQ